MLGCDCLSKLILQDTISMLGANLKMFRISFTTWNNILFTRKYFYYSDNTKIVKQNENSACFNFLFYETLVLLEDLNGYVKKSFALITLTSEMKIVKVYRSTVRCLYV